MVTGQGTFIPDTGDGTVREARDSVNHKRVDVNVSEDLLNRQIQDYGLVSVERDKNFFCPSLFGGVIMSQ
jgi:hypothetical protein